MIGVDGRAEEIVVRRRPDGTLRVLRAPALSAIAPATLDQLTAAFRPDPDVLELAPGVRYRIGALHQRTGVYVLHRLP